jgi:ABC-2 type transport system ATP-binding protein
MTGLKEYRNSLTAILSGGWKQRLAMACAVLHEPPIVFLDEPTSGADPLSRRRFWDLIYSMAEQGVTIFVTTHYMEEAEYCDRLAMIHNGRIIAMGTPHELKTSVMQEIIIDIRCPRPQDIIDNLSRVSVVKEVALFGAGIHAVVHDPDTAAAAIRNEFQAQGHEFEGVETIIPSMEDVFVSLIEAQEHSGFSK